MPATQGPFSDVSRDIRTSFAVAMIKSYGLCLVVLLLCSHCGGGRWLFSRLVPKSRRWHTSNEVRSSIVQSRAYSRVSQRLGDNYRRQLIKKHNVVWIVVPSSVLSRSGTIPTDKRFTMRSMFENLLVSLYSWLLVYLSF
jgi:hypothetical protein